MRSHGWFRRKNIFHWKHCMVREGRNGIDDVVPQQQWVGGLILIVDRDQETDEPSMMSRLNNGIHSLPAKFCCKATNDTMYHLRTNRCTEAMT